MLSPFLTLDEERRKRDQLLLEKLNEFGGSLSKAPLNFQTMFNEQEDRRRKIEADREELSRKRAEELRTSETHEQEKEKFQFDKVAGERRAEKENFDLEQNRSKASQDKISRAVGDLVAGMISQGAKDQEILERAFEHPDLGEVTDQSVIEGEIARQRNALAEKEGKAGLKGRELDIKQQVADARTKDADTRREAAKARIAASRAARDKPKRLLGEAATKRLEDLEFQLDSIAKIKEYKYAVDTGQAEGLLLNLGRITHFDSVQEALMNTELQQFINEELHRLGGATLTPQEYSRISKGLPAVYDEGDVFEALMDALEQKKIREYNLAVQTQGKAGRDISGFTPKKSATETSTDKSKMASDILEALLKGD